MQVARYWTRRAWSSAAVVVVVLMGVSITAQAEESESPPPAPLVTPTERDAKAAIKEFDRALKKIGKRASTEERARIEGELLTPFVLLSHADVAERLTEFVTDERHAMSSRVQALDGLRRHEDLLVEQVPALTKWLSKAAEAVADRRAKGDIGVPIDKRTGEAEKDTPEARAAMQRSRQEGALFAGTLEVVLEHGERPRKPEELLGPFVQHPFDDLVVVTLRAAREWDVQDIAKDVVMLLRMYPTVASWETGAVTHISGTNASAQAAWMRLYGHPDKQRARPAVYRAVTETLTAWAGREIKTPQDADAWLDER